MRKLAIPVLIAIACVGLLAGAMCSNRIVDRLESEQDCQQVGGCR